MHEFFENLNITIIIITVLITFSLIFNFILNKNQSIIILYIGLILLFIFSNLLGNLKFINKNNKFTTFYEKIKKTSLSNFKDVKEKKLFIFPNLFLTMLIFIISYLIFCFNSSLNLSNSTKTPGIIIFFVILFFISLFSFILSFILKFKEGTFDTTKLEFLQKGLIYNCIGSLIFGSLLAFLFYNLIHTFYRKGLFFQSNKICKDDGTCYYEPIGSNWFYKNSILL